MRFKLTLENARQQWIPINYQYPLSAWIYKTFAAADGEFADWLHEHGYAFNGNRKFKLFTFSNLRLKGVKFQARPAPVLSVSPGSQELLLSFYMEEAANHFIRGLFSGRDMVIADKNHRAEFRVSSVECLPAPEFGDTETFQCIAPMVLSRGRMTDGKLRAEYLSPEDEDYGHLLKENLIRKYVAANQEKVATVESDGNIENQYLDLPFDTDLWDFKLLNTPKSKLLTIKAGTPQQSKVRGFLFEFELTAPPELMAFGYQAGFGEKGSLGMGMVERLQLKQEPILY